MYGCFGSQSKGTSCKITYQQTSIEKILQGIGIGFKAEQLIDYVSRTMEKVRTVNNIASKVNNTMNGFLLEIIRDGANGLFCVMGISHYLPEYLVPVDSDEDGFDNQERYPPVQWITRIDQKKNIPLEKLSRDIFWEKETALFHVSRYIKKITQKTLFSR